MNFLVTAGNTQAPIDRVRCLTNVFTGRTGTSIARAAYDRGHHVTLLTSHPELVETFHAVPRAGRWSVRPYRTFDDLRALLTREIRSGEMDAVVHSAAVSDFLVTGVFAPEAGTRFGDGRWLASADGPRMQERGAAKVKSDVPELWLRLTRAPKLIDQVRHEWRFTGVLVKFKLEVAIADDELLQIAEQSRLQSDANLMVANTLEGAAEYAYIGPVQERYERVPRADLAARLVQLVEQQYGAMKRG